MPAPAEVQRLIENFDTHIDNYRSGKYNETQVRVDYVDPLFSCMGWDINNKANFAESYRDVLHEYSLTTKDGTKAPDYCFCIGGVRKFFLETKKPSVHIKDDVAPAFQVRRYGWSASLPLSILTDFEEFAVYDCRIRPSQNDRASVARLMYFTYKDYLDKWDELSGLFSKTAIQQGAFDKYVSSDKKKKGTSEIDKAFLADMEKWRELLAKSIALRNPKLSQRDMNHYVQATIDRIVFLRICEDRNIEDYGRLQALLKKENIYKGLCHLFTQADDKYNSGLFHFQHEAGRDAHDKVSLNLTIDDKPLNEIIRHLYYPQSPYVFSQIPAEILGQVYEKFLGKVIRLTPAHQAKVEEKPEVRKAGGVYYTPKYIVDYIVKNTVGELLKNKTPAQAKKLRVLDPACGSGSFLLGAYQYLLRWYLQSYSKEPAKNKKFIYQDDKGEWRLATQEKKDILLSNIYGVDIDRQAVEVTKLSLLLQVLDGENSDTLDSQKRLFHERALPDLRNNIKCGNSLIETDFFHGKNLDMFGREEMEKINAFDWDGKDGFPEIMRAGGFDAVIGNPPYVRQETLGEAFKQYVSKKYATYAGTADLYVYFIEKSCELLNKGGYYSVIVANKWMRGNYGRALREFLKNKKRIHELIDFGDLPVFQGATTYPCIIKISKATPKNFRALQVKELANSNSSDLLSALMKKKSYAVDLKYLQSEAWALNTEAEAKLLEKLKTSGAPLEEYVEGKIYYGIKTGFNEAFVIDTATKKRLIKADSKSAEIIKPFLEGKDIKRYGVLENRKWLIFTRRGIDIKKYPVILHYLENYKERLKPRPKDWRGSRQWLGRKPGTYQWYELQDTIDYYREFEKPKIVWGNLANEAPFSFDDSKNYVNAPGCILVTDDLYVLGCLNSKLNWYYLKSIAAGRQGGYIEAKPIYVSQITIPKHNVSKSEQIARFVAQYRDTQKCLHSSNSDSDRRDYEKKAGILDRQIDMLVYELYGLTPEEIKIVEGGV